jgi:hypothetical protein
MCEKIKHVLAAIEKKRGKSGGWPEIFKYKYDPSMQRAFICWTITQNETDKKTFRRFDSWGLAFLVELKNAGCNPNSLLFRISTEEDSSISPNLDFQSFYRRVSYLNINNKDSGVGFCVEVNGREKELLNLQSLYKRPENEILRSITTKDDDIKKTGTKGKESGRLEKDFQSFLFGGEISTDSGKTVTIHSDRLAILGEDFFNLKKNLKDKDMRWVCREFPTGVFDREISDKTRILPTEFIDFICLNKHGRLSVIELKLNDPASLEVASQLLDYALFVRSYYWDRIKNDAGHKFNDFKVSKTDYFECYVVNNRYHPRFDAVFFDYMIPKSTIPHEFKFTKLTLGYIERKRNDD